MGGTLVRQLLPGSQWECRTHTVQSFALWRPNPSVWLFHKVLSWAESGLGQSSNVVAHCASVRCYVFLPSKKGWRVVGPCCLIHTHLECGPVTAVFMRLGK